MTKDPIRSLRVQSGSALRLARHATDATLGWEKEPAKAELEKVKQRIDVLQARLAAEGSRGLLLVLQAMDAAGKDGTIRAIFSGVNPAGVKVTSFKVPGGPETQHDYLWRVHAAVPGKGEIGVFNRSHYEDVLVVRVKEFVPKSVWSKRFDHINAFERLLVDEGTTVVKIFLHISKDEQRDRLQERLDNPMKHWKFEHGDIAESRATQEVYGSRMPISALKSYTGHTLGACGSLESWVAVQMMRDGWFHPTINLVDVDPRCGDLDYVTGDGRRIDTEYVVNNNFAFGGINTSLVFRRWA